MNEVLRDWYVEDCQAGVDRWNKILERHGISDRLRLPDRKFNRSIGQFAGLHFDPDGRMLGKDEWMRRTDEWLPTPDDKAFLLSIMNSPIYDLRRFANYIAPPQRGIKGTNVDFGNASGLVFHRFSEPAFSTGFSDIPFKLFCPHQFVIVVPAGAGLNEVAGFAAVRAGTRPG
jgi:hypothetical protein